MLKEFKEFALKGNIIDLAVAVIIGTAFGKIITSLVDDILMPAISTLMGGISFVDLKYIITPASGDIAEVAIRYGAFIQSMVDFSIIALSIFLVIKLMTSRKKKEQEAEIIPVVPSNEEILLGEIRDLLKDK